MSIWTIFNLQITAKRLYKSCGPMSTVVSTESNGPFSKLVRESGPESANPGSRPIQIVLRASGCELVVAFDADSSPFLFFFPSILFCASKLPLVAVGTRLHDVLERTPRVYSSARVAPTSAG